MTRKFSCEKVDELVLLSSLLPPRVLFICFTQGMIAQGFLTKTTVSKSNISKRFFKKEKMKVLSFHDIFRAMIRHSSEALYEPDPISTVVWC